MLSAKSNQEENECKKEKIVTVTKKGAAVLDKWLPDHIKAHYHVLQLASLIVIVAACRVEFFSCKT